MRKSVNSSSYVGLWWRDVYGCLRCSVCMCSGADWCCLDGVVWLECVVGREVCVWMLCGTV